MFETSTVIQLTDFKVLTRGFLECKYICVCVVLFFFFHLFKNILFIF